VESSPGQQTGDRVEIRRIDIAAESSRLEGNGAAAAERVTDLRPVPEPQDPELFDELR
jgi:hypothetical protein